MWRHSTADSWAVYVVKDVMQLRKLNLLPASRDNQRYDCVTTGDEYLSCTVMSRDCLPDIARLITITTPAVRHTLLSSTSPYRTLTLRRHITDITANPHCVPISLISRWLAECTRLSKRHHLSQVSHRGLVIGSCQWCEIGLKNYNSMWI